MLEVQADRRVLKAASQNSSILLQVLHRCFGGLAWPCIALWVSGMFGCW